MLYKEEDLNQDVLNLIIDQLEKLQISLIIDAMFQFAPIRMILFIY